MRLGAEFLELIACSDFARESFVRDRSLLRDLLEQDALARRFTERACWPGGIEPRGDVADDEPAVLDALRRWRRREMVRIAWRDLCGRASLDGTLEDLSAFADRAISLAHDYAWQVTTARYGTPRGADGEVVPLVVLGMGKLGGCELNFSSDIDLVFLFPQYGETDHATPVSNDEFFIRLGQALIRLLAAPTAEGIVFRVDMRLRPFGDSGPLACGFTAFEDYLAQHGRDWERYAYVKARAIVGAEAYAELWASAVRPFVYRRYLDFGVFESLREMKQLIEKQGARKGMAEHIKLGPGGIREIEFVVQAFQLIRGGQDRRLQTARLFEALPQLAGSKQLGATTVAELDAAYRFLRTLENRLQMQRDEQTHQLPSDPARRAQLARAMLENDWAALAERIAAQRDIVLRHFDALVFQPTRADAAAAPAVSVVPGAGTGPSRGTGTGSASGAAAALGVIWDETLAPAGLAEQLDARGLRDSDEVARLLVELRDSARTRRLDASSLRRLQLLVPQLLAELRPDDEALAILRRFLRVIEAIGARSAYFALLIENPGARARFVEICRGGDFLPAQIAAHPLLLDELLDQRTLVEPPSRAELAADLADRMARVQGDDPERLVEALCQFKRAAVFRVAIADLSGRLPLMRVSDRLTDIAELIVEEAMRQAWQQMTAQFGMPTCDADDAASGAQRTVRVCAVGYGKLGGIELGYASDLDLVFLHDSAGTFQETVGSATPTDNQVFFVRLAQRIVHLLTVHSPAGRLYEVDMRLRPSGKGGMLITQIEAFVDYQRREAWTWEHQALLHARSVAGSTELRQRFERERLALLREAVRRDSLAGEVRSMRERMRRELSKAKAGEFDLKQDAGGIADIEFLAQYWALLWAQRYEAVALYSDTIRQLETLASGALVPQQTVDVLVDAYRTYRARAHHRSLRDAPAIVGAEEFEAERRAVRTIWDSTFAAAQATGL